MSDLNSNTPERDDEFEFVPTPAEEAAPADDEAPAEEAAPAADEVPASKKSPNWVLIIGIGMVLLIGVLIVVSGISMIRANRANQALEATISSSADTQAALAEALSAKDAAMAEAEVAQAELNAIGETINWTERPSLLAIGKELPAGRWYKKIDLVPYGVEKIVYSDGTTAVNCYLLVPDALYDNNGDVTKTGFKPGKKLPCDEIFTERTQLDSWIPVP